MTSEKVMLNLGALKRAAVGGAIGVAAALLLGGCDLLPKRIEQPTLLASPYPGPKLWAVAPLRNESGTSLIDPAALADHVAQQFERVDGIEVLAVNRTLQAMAAERLSQVHTVTDARAVMQRLDVDGLIVGTVTAWNPYEPPKIGAKLHLYSRENPFALSALDTRRLTASPVNTLPDGTRVHRQPVATASGYFDAASGKVVKALHAYARGRTPEASPSGPRRYLISMDLYSEFVSHELAKRLLDAERKRLMEQATPPPDSNQADGAGRP